MSWKGWQTKEMDDVLRDLRRIDRKKAFVFDCLTPRLLSRVKEKKFESGHDYYAIPLLSDNHYILFIFLPKQNAVFYVDSLGAYFEEDRINEWLSTIERAGKASITQWADMFDKPVQDEENTCGAYVVAAVKAVLTSEPHDWPRKTLELVPEMKRLLDKKALE
jgi:Ulp1 family protease